MRIGSLRAIALLFAISNLTACADKPIDVVEKHVIAASEGNVEEVKDTLPPSMGDSLDHKIAMIVMEESQRAASRGGVKKIEILSEEITGNSGRVEFMVHYGNGSNRKARARLIKIKNSWYLSEPPSASMF